MPRFKDNYLSDLKDRVSILDVVSPHVQLKRAGKSWKGLSPFSQEKTPSFFVNPERNSFKCFSTDTGGDAIRFVELVENLTFIEAVETLARAFNYPVQYERGSSKDAIQASSVRAELFRIHEEASNWYRERFLADDEEGAYIRDFWTKQRNFSLETAEEFEVGFAPPRGGLGKALASSDYSREALKASELFFSGGKERFRGRLMIPIHDTQSRIVAFTARQLEVTPENDPAREAKYVNSAETPIFRKSNLLFNLDKARRHVNERKSLLLVEGQLDAMRCWEVGAKATVAPQGTAFTEMQARLMSRHQAESIEILFDGDKAGRSATLRILPIAMEAGLEVTVLQLPQGQDPDDLLAAEGTDALDTLRKTAKDAMSFAVEALLDGDANPSPDRKGAVLGKVFEILYPCSSIAVQEGYLRKASILLQVSEDAAKQDFRVFRSKRIRRKPILKEEPKSAENHSQKLTTVEYDLLFHVLHYEEIAVSLSQVIDLEWINTGSVEGFVLTRILNELQAGIWEKDQLDSLDFSEEERKCVVEINAEGSRFPEPLDSANECLSVLFASFLRRKENELTDQLANQNPNNLDQAKALQSELGQLRAQSLNPPTLLPTTKLYGHDQDQYEEQTETGDEEAGNRKEEAAQTGVVFGFE